MKRRKGLRPKGRGNPKHKAWKVFSEYIRRRDADENGMVKCISCATVDHWKNMDAGHFIPKSVSSALRFHELNVHGQCPSCNQWKSGNLTDYALSLQRHYGPDILEKLDEIRRYGEGSRITKSDYLDLIDKYTEKLKKLEAECV